MKRSLQIGMVVLSLFGMVSSASAGGNKNGGGSNNSGNRNSNGNHGGNGQGNKHQNNGGNSSMRQQGGSSNKMASQFNGDSLKKIAHPNGSRNNGEKHKHQDNFGSTKPQFNGNLTKIATPQQIANQRPSWNSPNHQHDNQGGYTRHPLDGRVQTPDVAQNIAAPKGYVFVNGHMERAKAGTTTATIGGTPATFTVRDHRAAANVTPPNNWPGYGGGHHGSRPIDVSRESGGVKVTTTPGGNSRGPAAITGHGFGLHTITGGLKDLVTTEVGDSGRPAVVDHRRPGTVRDHRMMPHPVNKPKSK